MDQIKLFQECINWYPARQSEQEQSEEFSRNIGTIGVRADITTIIMQLKGM